MLLIILISARDLPFVTKIIFIYSSNYYQQPLSNKEIYIDTDYNVILINKVWLLGLFFKVEIKRISKSLRVKDLNSIIYNIDQYILILIFILDIKENSIRVLYYIFKEIYLINNFKIYILIENDIVDSK